MHVRSRGVHIARLLAVLAAVGLLAALAAPAGAGGKGKLKVTTSLPAPGFWNGNTPAKLDGGYEWGIAKEIAKRLGYSGFTVKNVSFDALVAGKAKGFDLALSQVTITKPRAKVVAFTTPYFDSDLGILVKTGTKVDESNLKDIQWGVQGATTSQTFLEDKIKPSKTPRSYTETTQAFAALQAGQVDAVLLDTSIVLQQASASNGVFEVVGQLRSGEHYGGITAKGSKLLKSFNKTIKALKADGTLSDLADKYLTAEFGKDPQKVPYLTP